MRRFFNRDNPLEPGSKKKRIEFVYHFRAYDANAKELLFNMLERGYSGGNVVGLGGGGAPVSTSSQVTQKPMPYGIRSYLPYAELVLLNIPERLDEFCTSNIAFFKSDEREFQALGKSAEQYFNAGQRIAGVPLSIGKMNLHHRCLLFQNKLLLRHRNHLK